jgi:endonuclease/exonuclease/phosphatase family metal-dependent hydrolase
LTCPRAIAAALATAVVTLALAAPAGAASTSDRDVTVMSRNLYLGADIITAATAANVDELKARASTLFQTVQQTNFPVRAQVIAREIDTNDPDLVGLQEVALWRRTPDGVTNTVKDANVVVYDFLALLQKEIKARGLHYKAAVAQQEADFEVPTSLNYDLRLTMRDVILVRTGSGAKVKVSKTLKGNYTDKLSVTVPSGAIDSLRGWTAVDAKVGQRSFRFVNTHLEAYGGELRDKQAKQLLKGPLASKKKQIILVGDLNSDARDADPEGLAYKSIRAAGFVDAFKKAPATSGQDEKLDNPGSKLKRYIDHIMSRATLKTIRSKVFGNRPADRIQGLWPSDHAGTVATLRLPE